MKKHNKISQDEFYTYEVIRSSGLTNMLDINQVIQLSVVMEGPVLTWDSIIEIQTNYKKYLELYPLPRNGIVKIKAAELKEEYAEEGPEWLEPDPDLAKQAVEELRQGKGS